MKWNPLLGGIVVCGLALGMMVLCSSAPAAVTSGSLYGGDWVIGTWGACCVGTVAEPCPDGQTHGYASCAAGSSVVVYISGTGWGEVTMATPARTPCEYNSAHPEASEYCALVADAQCTPVSAPHACL